MAGDSGLIYACLLDGKGSGKTVGWDDVTNWNPSQGLLWTHLEYSDEHIQQWLLNESGLDEITAEALLAEETRPRSIIIGDSLLLTLRGVNLNPGADPEDMVAVRLWSDGQRIITTRKRRLQVTAEITERIERGTGPETAGEFVDMLTDTLVELMANVVDELNDEVDAMEEMVLTMESYELRPKLAELRRRVIGLRRYLAPQREAMSRLFNEKVSWLNDMDRLRLRETADRSTRHIEDLDLIRERSIVVQEELMSRLSEKMDRTMYVLSIVAAIFLPLGFLTGLLGINVGGIPGSDYSGSFVIFCLILIVVVAIQVWLFKRKKWM